MNINISSIKKSAAILCASTVISSVLAACGIGGGSASQNTEAAQSPDTPEKISIVTTIFPPYDFAKQLSGDLADVTMLVGPGEEIHTYEPTPQDILRIQNADIFIYAGGESESWVNGILGSFDSSSIETIDMMELCEVVEEEIVEGMEAEESDSKETGSANEKEYDEHVWTSIDNSQIISQAIADALCEADEEHESVYRENCISYLAELSSLKKEIGQTVNGASRKTLIFGDRFPVRYFTEEFGLDYYAAFPGCAEQTEPSAGTVAFLINKTRDENIPVVFYIEMSNGKVAQTIAESTGAKTLCFNSCHNVTMEQFKNGVTYIDLMKQNAESLKEALY
ncbi:MAG: zinc ABC transporter substrate-binding protein [Clostridia bacterium]|nr:zinc ABC transporter substrate-binding protein [Clostridia bacterium]